MDLGIDHQRVVVVGAAGGIGRAIGARLCKEHVRTIWIDRDAQVFDAAKAVDPDAEREGRVRVVDATNEDAINALAASIEMDLGGCEHVINCVGVGSGKLGFPFWNLTPADWSTVIEGNLMAAVNTMHAFAPRMARAKRGSFVLFSSVAGQIGSQTDPPYSASKAAIINFAQCAAKDLAEYGLRVNVVSPGMVRTEINRQVWMAWQAAAAQNRLGYDEWAAEKITRVSPLGRWQTTDELAAVVSFLISQFAVSITGQTINVDGGQVMHS